MRLYTAISRLGVIFLGQPLSREVHKLHSQISQPVQLVLERFVGVGLPGQHFPIAFHVRLSCTGSKNAGKAALPDGQGLDVSLHRLDAGTRQVSLYQIIRLRNDTAKQCLRLFVRYKRNPYLQVSRLYPLAHYFTSREASAYFALRFPKDRRQGCFTSALRGHYEGITRALASGTAKALLSYTDLTAMVYHRRFDIGEGVGGESRGRFARARPTE
jgi:hypothetical protein